MWGGEQGWGYDHDRDQPAQRRPHHHPLYAHRDPIPFVQHKASDFNRIAYAAAHVVADPLASNDPWLTPAIDWDTTLKFRHRLWDLGLGVAEAMDTAQRGVRTDDNGLPIHGLLAADGGWRVTAQSADELVAELDFGARPELLASFPFPHLLEVGVTLRNRTLTVRTVVTPTADRVVPLCFGFHPYLQLPGVPRQQWWVQTPALRHLVVDGRGLPTGATTPQEAGSQALGDKVFDDGYDEVAEGALFAVSGGDRRIEVIFEQGYPAAQIFAPAGADLICFEPMAAPTDALTRGGYATALPGHAAVAQFAIKVS